VTTLHHPATTFLAEAAVSLEATAPKLPALRRAAAKAVAAHRLPLVHAVEPWPKAAATFGRTERVETASECFRATIAGRSPSPIVALREWPTLEVAFAFAHESSAARFLKSSAFPRRAAAHWTGSHARWPHPGAPLTAAVPQHFLPQSSQKILKPREDRVLLIGFDCSAPHAFPCDGPVVVLFFAAALGRSVARPKPALRRTKSARPARTGAVAISAHGRLAILLHPRPGSTSAAAPKSTAEAAPPESSCSPSRAAGGRTIGVPRGRLGRWRIRSRRGDNHGKQSHGTPNRENAAQHKASSFRSGIRRLTD
jgi:hypothetical protein